MKFLLVGLLAAAALSASSDHLDHSAWKTILGRRVNDAALVDYAGIKAHDLTTLDAYISQLAQPWPKSLTAAETKAALINAYNALTVRWMVANYPTESIWRTHHPFTEARYTLDGTAVSLDQIESRLRAFGDARIHGAIVCASLSCPPLRNEAYQSATLDRQLDENVRTWLANAALNEFIPRKRTAKVSMIFKWYADDFRKSYGSVEKFLALYGPSGQASLKELHTTDSPDAAKSAEGPLLFGAAPGGLCAFLLQPGAKLEYFAYRWGINDTSKPGVNYSAFQFYLDAAKNKYF